MSTSTAILIALAVLGLIGAVFSVVLYIVAQKFKVEEDPMIDEVAEALPGANCGGCGKAGCRAFAEACVAQKNLDGLRCAPGGDAVAQKIATILGCTSEQSEPQVAVVRCCPSHKGDNRCSNYDGLRSCAFANSVYVGESGCAFGCLGCGDCVAACQFDAIKMNDNGVPEVDEDKCTACGACAKACPRGIIELRNKGRMNRRVYVRCVNKEKGANARKTCDNACIGCGKCEKVCPFDAVHVTDNVAYIDYTKCKACRKCVTECPTGAITDVNFPAPAKKPVVPAAPVATTTAPTAQAEPVVSENNTKTTEDK
ncbi:MAG: RnfABCDGE type electron transport complex subunit B [Bacteroidales bacterium]|nr:RnfABCDGE type electron transport complex subunit B [Bacteroidales bacterium]